MGVSDGDGEDPWGFLADRKERAKPVDAEPAVSGDEQPPAPVPPAAQPRAEPSTEPARGGSAGRARGELRAEMGGPSMKRRAWPMAAALVGVAFAGFLTETVGASQMITLAGPSSLIYMYPLGGLGLLGVALLSFRFIDHSARLPMIRAVTGVYALVFAVALALISQSVWPVGATAVVWLLGDQLNFLVPLLIWALAGDEFNVAEGRRIFGWIVAWTYVGQVAGLAVATAAPTVLQALSVPLPALLVFDPLVCAAIAIFLPRAMRRSQAGRGVAHNEGTRQSLSGAWDFIAGVPIWRTLLIASVLTFSSVMTSFLAYMSGAGIIIGDDAGALQTLFGAVALVVFVLCWILQKTGAHRIQERLGIPGTLMVLPVVAVVAGVVLALGSAFGSLVLLVVGISLVRIPRWTIDENARRAALAFVPDERRARVSFFVDLGPVALGLIVAGPLALVGLLTGVYWIVPLIGAILAAAAIHPSLVVVRGWDASMMNWRLRRRKQNRTLDLD